MKSYTDIEQSKKLAEILPLESADMGYGHMPPYKFMGKMYDGGYDKIPYPKDFLKLCADFCEEDIYDSSLPCWSLAALLSVIPKHIKDCNVLRIDISEKDFAIWYDETGYGVNNDLPNITMESAVDACCELILKLHKLNLL